MNLKKKSPVTFRRRFTPLMEILEERTMPTAGAFLQGYAYHDLNVNGHFDSCEGLLGANIRLLASNQTTVIGNATTDTTGYYIFKDGNGTVTNNNLTAGTYYLVESTAPAGYVNTSVDFFNDLDSPAA